MKRVNFFVAGAALAVAMFAGCKSAPSSLERKFFLIETNLVGHVMVVTNVVPAYSTNYVVVQETNWVGGVPAAVSVTNATVSTRWETNRAVATNYAEEYAFKPNTAAEMASRVAGSAAGAFTGFGELVAIVVSAAFGIWGHLRSARARRVAGVLAEVIEAGRLVLQATPQGQALDAEWKVWMMKHQAEQGVITDVVRLLGSVVDNATAREAAAKLVKLMEERNAQ